jgi:hypothetical protein
LIGCYDVLGLRAEIYGPPAKRAIAHNVIGKLTHEPHCAHIVGFINKDSVAQPVALAAPSEVVGKDNDGSVTKIASGARQGTYKVALRKYTKCLWIHEKVSSANMNNKCIVDECWSEQVLVLLVAIFL